MEFKKKKFYGLLAEFDTPDQMQGSRTSVYDIEVTNQNGDRIAVFRGRSYRMKGKQVVT